MSAIKISPAARADIERIFLHLCNFDVKAATIGSQALLAGFRYLSENPLSGEKVMGASPMRKSVVDTGSHPYWILHRHEAATDVTLIARIIHPHLSETA